MAGSVQKVLVCQPGTAPFGTANPCPTVNGTAYRPAVVESYLFDTAGGSNLEASTAPFDVAQGGVLFGSMFTISLLLWILGKSVGLVLKSVRQS